MKKQIQSNPRARILEVVDDLFYTEGVRTTGTEKIMALAEVAKATFYRHFASKDELVLAYLEHRDRALWSYLAEPAPAKTVREALIRFEQYANRPDVVGCPFLRVASEYPQIAHPFHVKAIEHQNAIVDYLVRLLKPFAIDRLAAAAAIQGVIDGAFSMRMLYGPERDVTLVTPALAVLKSFRAQDRRELRA